MDPWYINESQNEECLNSQADSFEDNFKPTVSETLPDSKRYLETLENKLHKLKSDSNVLKQLAEKREECLQQLLSGAADYDQDRSELESPVNPSLLLRAVAPERQAITTGEVVQLVKYDLLNSQENLDNSDTASR